MATSRTEQMAKAYRRKENYSAATMIEAKSLTKWAIQKAKGIRNKSLRLEIMLSIIESRYGHGGASLVESMDLNNLATEESKPAR